MSSVEQVAKPLKAGERLSREEFLRRWEALPQVKKAELIGGVVYMPSPVSIAHAAIHSLVIHWLGHYADFTPGCEAGDNGTWFMLEDAPQPDANLRILPEYGGRSCEKSGYGQGAPELAAEVCLSSASYDLGPKLNLYRAAGVQEYITVLLEESQVMWRRLAVGNYSVLEPDSDGILRSRIFPGLWLDPVALLKRDTARRLEVSNRGLQSPEHVQFLKALAARKRV